MSAGVHTPVAGTHGTWSRLDPAEHLGSRGKDLRFDGIAGSDDLIWSP